MAPDEHEHPSETVRPPDPEGAPAADHGGVGPGRRSGTATPGHVGSEGWLSRPRSLRPGRGVPRSERPALHAAAEPGRPALPEPGPGRLAGRTAGRADARHR